MMDPGCRIRLIFQRFFVCKGLAWGNLRGGHCGEKRPDFRLVRGVGAHGLQGYEMFDTQGTAGTQSQVNF